MSRMRCMHQCPKCRLDVTLASRCIAIADERDRYDSPAVVPQHEHLCARQHRWADADSTSGCGEAALTSEPSLRRSLPRALKAQADLVQQWQVPIGTPVDVHRGNGAVIRTKTSSAPWLLGGHTAVIHVEGLEGAYVLELVRAVDESPAPVVSVEAFVGLLQAVFAAAASYRNRRMRDPKPPLLGVQRARPAVVTVRAVTVECPICHERVDSEEGERLHTECVTAQPGVVTCANCDQRFAVPDLSTVFRRIVPKRAR